MTQPDPPPSRPQRWLWHYTDSYLRYLFLVVVAVGWSQPAGSVVFNAATWTAVGVMVVDIVTSPLHIPKTCTVCGPRILSAAPAGRSAVVGSLRTYHLWRRRVWVWAVLTFLVAVNTGLWAGWLWALVVLGVSSLAVDFVVRRHRWYRAWCPTCGLAALGVSPADGPTSS